MSEFRSSHRYALAILGVAGEQGTLDDVSKDFGMIERLLKENRDFLRFLRSPVVNKEKKRRVLTEILKGQTADLTLKFILLLNAKGRESILPEVISQFYLLRDKRLGILAVTARTAVPMTPGQQEQLSRQLEETTKKKIRLSTVVDPSLKGGFTVQYNDTVWDASVAHQLELLRQRFLESPAL